MESVKDNGVLSRQTVKAIEKARRRIRTGRFLTEHELKKRLSLR